MATLTLDGSQSGVVLKDGVYFYPTGYVNAGVIAITVPAHIGGDLISTGAASDITSTSDLNVCGNISSGRDILPAGALACEGSVVAVRDIIAGNDIVAKGSIMAGRVLTAANSLVSGKNIYAFGAILAGVNIQAKESIVSQANITATAGFILCDELLCTDNAIACALQAQGKTIYCSSITSGAAYNIFCDEMFGTVSAGIVLKKNF